MKSLINQICVCRSCNGDTLEIHNTEKKGLSLQFSIECNDCDWTFASFNDINNNLHQIYIDTALQSMKSAANEVLMSVERSSSEGDIVDCQVSIDGSWYKRAHSSMNGFVTAISTENKKVIEYQVFSKFCKKGAYYGNKKRVQRNIILGKRHTSVK